MSFPGAYAGTDPGIKINIYQTLANYTIPGPPVFSCDGASALPPPPPSSELFAAFTIASTSSFVIC